MTDNTSVSAPLAVITPTDHSGLVIIACIFGLFLVLIFMIVRVFARLYISPPFGRDDYALFVATGFGIIYSALIFTAVAKGFGKAENLITPAKLIGLQKAAYASDLFLLITLWCSKCSMACLFMRLTPRKQHQRVSKGLLIATTIWLILSMFIIALRCDLARPWIFIDTKCRGLVYRWQVIGAFDIAIEVALFAMSILLVKDLKMALTRKIGVVIAFGLRLPMIAFTILRLRSFSIQTLSDDPTLSGVFFFIWSVIEVDFSICSGNIACLKPFMAAFNTSYGGSAEIHALSNVARSGGESGLSTIGSMRFDRRTKPREGKGAAELPPRQFRSFLSQPDGLGNEAGIIQGDAESIESHGSRQMIIQKDVSFNVEYNNRDTENMTVDAIPSHTE